ncbi:MAG TPA: aldo/keto reductase [Lachnospiraceae bacterium]|nr:aldo/keto reductase [Lachnospiraceae bacterium]
MEYRVNPKNNDKLSLLGFGCLRFQKKQGNIIMEEANRQIMNAIEHGVNYFDTAYVYGGSEEALGQVLFQNQCREKVYIATKLPHYFIKKQEDMERYFKEQCKRLKTDYIDYYLIHMLPDRGTFERLWKLGVFDWLEEKKAKGIIHNIGFSYHGNTSSFQELLDLYSWDFCQIQYNYVDEHSQAGRAGLKKANKMGIPVIIMEPLRGGRLVTGLPKEALKEMENVSKNRTPAEWGLRWLFDQEEVTVVLSGMNTNEMVEENIRIASKAGIHCITEEEREVYRKVKEILNEKVKVPCTGCGYCMPCPKGVDIPGAFRCYNVRYTDGLVKAEKEYIMCTTMRSKRSNASLCVSCGKCEKHCPQEIAIRKELKNVKRTLESPVYKVVSGVIGVLRRF